MVDLPLRFPGDANEFASSHGKGCRFERMNGFL